MCISSSNASLRLSVYVVIRAGPFSCCAVNNLDATTSVVKILLCAWLLPISH